MGKIRSISARCPQVFDRCTHQCRANRESMAREPIRIEDVHRAFGPVKVLDSVNLRIDEGDRIGIVGHNGAGKTTYCEQYLTKIRTLEISHFLRVFVLPF